MQAFSLPRTAILTILEALANEVTATDDIAIRVRMKENSFSEDLTLTDLGLETGSDAVHALQDAIRSFFCLEETPAKNFLPDQKIGQWVNFISDAMSADFRYLGFRPAGGAQTEICRHRTDLVFQDAAAAAGLLHGRRRLVSLVSPHSVLGLSLTTLTPQLIGVANVDARKMAPDALSAFFAFGDVIVATPSYWGYLVSERVSVPDNAVAVCFGEPLVPQLASEMRRAGIAIIRELYGSTQTGLIAWRDSPTDDFVLFDHWAREGDGLVRRLPCGKRVAQSPMDRFAWRTDRTFALSGRLDGAVQIGAVNVFPDQIANHIAAHPLVQHCDVTVSLDAASTNRLIANITLVQQHSVGENTAREIDRWCREKLAYHERPHVYNFFS